MERAKSLSDVLTDGSSTATSSKPPNRYGSAFTEAVPLSLSSMAHASIPLNEGVLDGLKQVLQHTLFQCVNYARKVYAPHTWSFRDLQTSEFAWQPVKESLNVLDLPFSLQKMNFAHQYSRNALIYLKAAIPVDLTQEKELELVTDETGDHHWSHQTGILGCVRLLYASTEQLTPGELDGSDVEDIPPCIMYKAVVEYRSLPATGNQQAVQAEELSMLSFGGSVDDDVKYGALASLYDEHAKYVLEIYSVRGKKYKFDLMDAILSDRTVPHLPSTREGDPFVKSCCVTVTDHKEHRNDEMSSNNSDNVAASNDAMYAITRMHLTMEGKPRGQQRRASTVMEEGSWHDKLPPFNYMTQGIASTFLSLDPDPPLMVAASPSGHRLLLDPEQAGNIYVNGYFVTKWGEDARIGSHGIALFGIDLHSIPFWHGRIVDYEVMKHAYAQLWHELLVDARLLDLNIANILLYRLMKGRDPPEDDNDLYDTDGDEDEVVDNPDVHMDCLESQVLAAPHYDVVGIAAKALATRFAIEFGKDAFPCRGHETEWVQKMLPDREPTVVPQRLINILRRGGYFDTQKTADLLWFTESRPVKDELEATVVAIAVQYLEAAGCTDVDSENIVFISSHVADNVVAKDAVCRFNSVTEQFFVHQDFMSAPVDEYIGEKMSEADSTRIKGYLLGMYIAKAHPFGKVLARYLVRNELSS